MKGNQPRLEEDIATLFAEEGLETRQASQRGRHGNRFERRRLRASSELNEYLDWPGVAQVLEITRWVRQGQGEPTVEVRYGITSLREEEASPARLLKLVRGHWGIENRLHYVRDVTFLEDGCRIRTQAAPQAMAALRNFVVGLLHGHHARNIAAALRRNAARPRRVINWVTTRPP